MVVAIHHETHGGCGHAVAPHRVETKLDSSFKDGTLEVAVDVESAEAGASFGLLASLYDSSKGGSSSSAPVAKTEVTRQADRCATGGPHRSSPCHDSHVLPCTRSGRDVLCMRA